MLPFVHAQITRQALQQTFSPLALKQVVAANVLVDAIWNQVGRDELHFDNNAFTASWAYISAQRELIRPALEQGRAAAAWRAFGRLTHTAQDFYSHSNYIDLWLACQPNGIVPAPNEIEPLDEALVHSPSLRSGKAYLPFGVLSFVPGLGRLILPRFPVDSHARMNLDSAARGPLFPYAFAAAVKRTRQEYDLAVRDLPKDLLDRFRGLTLGAPAAN